MYIWKKNLKIGLKKYTKKSKNDHFWKYLKNNAKFEFPDAFLVRIDTPQATIKKSNILEKWAIKMIKIALPPPA